MHFLAENLFKYQENIFKHSLWLVRWFLIYIESKIVNQLDRFEAFICKVNGKYMNSYQNRSSSLDLQGKMNEFWIAITR